MVYQTIFKTYSNDFLNSTKRGTQKCGTWCFFILLTFEQSESFLNRFKTILLDQEMNLEKSYIKNYFLIMENKYFEKIVLLLYIGKLATIVLALLNSVLPNVLPLGPIKAEIPLLADLAM